MITNEDLDRKGLSEADRAFIDSQADGDTVALSVRKAIAAYVGGGHGSYRAFLAEIPSDHPEMPSGMILTRSLDGGATWEMMTRPPGVHTSWSRPVPMAVAP